MLRSERRRTCQYQHHHKFDQRIKKECLSGDKRLTGTDRKIRASGGNLVKEMLYQTLRWIKYFANLVVTNKEYYVHHGGVYSSI